MFDVTVVGAVLAGLLSFVSPCILPMVPFYLGYMAGGSAHQMAQAESIPRDIHRRTVIGSLFFAAGVITVFVGLGASATVFGQLVRDYFDLLRWAAAALIILMGLHFLGILKIGLLYRQFRSDAGATGGTGYATAYLIGLAFAFGWTPCVGPVLAAILFTAAGQDSAMQGAILLFAYGAGMTFPFVLAAFFIRPFMAWMVRFRRHLGLIEKITGALLVVFGLLIATNSMNLIAQWMLDHMPWFGAIG